VTSATSERSERDEGTLNVLTTSGEPIARFFAFGHLPEHLRGISRPFAELAVTILANCPRNAERTVALRKLLEAKDCAVRASLPE
jgi:hypothetical protein